MTAKLLAVTDLAPAHVRREQVRATTTDGARYGAVRGVVEGIRLRQARRWVRRTEEPASAWLTAEQNVLLEAQRAAGGMQRSSDSDGIIDSRAGCRMIEIFAAILPNGWG